ncbi:transferase hexapeptide repeat containing protein [Luminiphilus syltensis NOR5-1B]|uniref:Transferase hexapeptide repeat containing protein n=1 Tax=Luminiphilus syltensis NOR5-1B TaxID=565045 RepID=B8KUU8_9GAMM|nr:acyltransferase [Luminiphilus syltensis]EED36804.1 transferase hexapeptide repeat containing protein [Luminiphilus syltensis NOR5-1B]
MRPDLRPYWVKRAYLRFCDLWVDYFIRPHCEYLGPHATFMRPWTTHISGDNIRIGHSFTAVSTSAQPIEIGVWGRGPGEGRITLGNACLMSPGSRISASDEITLGNGVMLANGAYITDSDWHGLYDRIARDPAVRPVIIGDNVWVGDHALVLKGVSIGANSVIAARAVVSRDVPENVVVAGNPATVVRQLDPEQPRNTRADFFADPEATACQIDAIDRQALAGNRFLPWLWGVIYPGARARR